EHALGRRIGRAAGDVVGGDRFARLGQALLVGVGIGAVDAIGDRPLQVFGRAEAERARVADVELDQLPALAFEFAGPAGQLAADLVAHFGQALADGQAGYGHRRGGGRGGGRRGNSRSYAGPARGRRARPVRAGHGLDSPQAYPVRTRVTAPPVALRAVGWPWPAGAAATGPWAEAMAAHPRARPARVVEPHRAGYVVADATDHVFDVQSPPQWQRPPGYHRAKVSPDASAVGRGLVH